MSEIVEIKGTQLPDGTVVHFKDEVARSSIESLQVIGGDKHYTHIQSTSSDLWSIQHNLGKYPSITVVDSAGSEVVGDVNHTSTNSVEITFMSAFSGKAYLN